MKLNELMRAFLRKKLQTCSNFATMRTIRGTKGEKSPVNATFSGRSMVEMLGVLAIIGVLSVGAIAGYSKAMMKYKLNKQSEQYNFLINIMYTYKYMFRNHNTGNGVLFDYLKRLNLLPEHFIKNDGNYHDIMENKLHCFSLYTAACASTSAGCNYMGCDINIDPNYAMQSCQNLLNVFKNNSNVLWFTNMQNSTSEGKLDIINSLYGDEFCDPSKQSCLRDLSISKIYDFCTTCNGDKYTSCTLRFTLTTNK